MAKSNHLTFCIAHDDFLSSFGDAMRVRKNVMEQKERIMSCEKKPAVSRREYEAANSQAGATH